MRLGRIATLAMLAIVASVPAMAQTIARSGEPFNPPAVSVRRYVTRMVDSLGGHKAGMRDSAVWETPARTLPVPMPMGGMYAADTSARVFATDNSGNLYVTDASRDRDYAQWATCLTAQSLGPKTKLYQQYPVAINEFGKIMVHVSWSLAAADSGKQDSLQLEVVPILKQSEEIDGYDYSVDLDPTCPGVNGVYITREATPLPVYGYGVNWTATGSSSTSQKQWPLKVPTTTGDFSMMALVDTTTALPPMVTNSPPGTIWMRHEMNRTDSLNKVVADGTRLMSASDRTVLMMAPAMTNAGGRQYVSFYYAPPITVYSNARWYTTPSNGNGSYDNMNTVAFPLTMKNGAWINGYYLGFMVYNHSATVTLQNVTVDVWQVVN